MKFKIDAIETYELSEEKNITKFLMLLAYLDQPFPNGLQIKRNIKVLKETNTFVKHMVTKNSENY